ncbi:DUF2920 family protein [Campylobacter lari]|uniref:DUF2920 family protein n=1 Tax=Campylobacter lari TaxID=201 RepID=UPI00126C95CD|nr:DUF2920 family protein [Campylobacter lari]EAI0925095.1 DUF2920 family protein [Campylobacter lari]EAI2016560.1 DUF2920 family protein [Campylobacter lari]EAI2315463.1 DUF2920 family protein [Campylobacter lari]EAI2404171.1 DUF2920 family protein [Campylobacter lari]EAI2990850.1 DUF2920 family protein [Campylobacter lari]
MLKNETYFIDSCDDVELGIKRESKLEYRITYDDSKQMKAIVCIISGFGDDANSDYRRHLAETICNNFDVIVLSVEYHCIGSRLNNGAKIVFDDIDEFILEHSCKAFGIKWKDFSYDDLKYIDQQMIELKSTNKIRNQNKIQLSATLKPTKNEYQNFGIMQAIDISNAILHVEKNMGGGIPVILVGSSHGGYLANLCAKISPWIVDGIIDNSSYALTPLVYLGFAKEIDYTKNCEFYINYSKNIDLFLFTKSFWTSNQYSSCYFSNARKSIRDILNYEHLKLQSSYRKIPYISYHSIYDTIAPFKDKKELYGFLDKLGFDVYLYEINCEKQIDGRLIKDLNHGLGMSIKTLTKKHLPQILQKSLKDKTCKKEISYKCDDLVYAFKEDNNQIILSIVNSN